MLCNALQWNVLHHKVKWNNGKIKTPAVICGPVVCTLVYNKALTL